MNNQHRDPHKGADYHEDIQISGNAEMPSGSEQPDSKRNQQFVSAQQGIESSSGDSDDQSDQPNIEPSETDAGQSAESGPGRTPGKAEGEDDVSAAAEKKNQDVENYERTKEKKLAETVSGSS